MSDGKSQSIMTIGLGLIIIGVLILGFALSQPRMLIMPEIAETVTETVTQTVTVNSVEAEVSVSLPLNLNTCTYDQLVALDGIGERKAELIIAYRDYLGGYTSVEQLKDISGIGDGVYEKIAPYFTV